MVHTNILLWNSGWRLLGLLHDISNRNEKEINKAKIQQQGRKFADTSILKINSRRVIYHCREMSLQHVFFMILLFDFHVM